MAMVLILSAMGVSGVLAWFGWIVAYAYINAQARHLIDRGIDRKMEGVDYTWFNRFMLWRLQLKVVADSGLTPMYHVHGRIWMSDWRLIEYDNKRAFVLHEHAVEAADKVMEYVVSWLAGAHRRDIPPPYVIRPTKAAVSAAQMTTEEEKQ